jgi:Probable zinc-ribbon domain
MAKEQTLKCKDCKSEFIFSEGEQFFFSVNEFPPPVRCPACRKKSEGQAAPATTKCPHQNRGQYFTECFGRKFTRREALKQTRWVDYRDRSYRPVRILEFEKGTIVLQQAEWDDHWRIATYWHSGLLEKSQHFTIPSACHTIFEEKCAELTQGEKNILVEELEEPIESHPPRYRADVAKELGRLCIADDELVSGIDAWCENFAVKHTDAECETYISEGLARYKAMLASGGEEEE